VLRRWMDSEAPTPCAHLPGTAIWGRCQELRPSWGQMDSSSETEVEETATTARGSEAAAAPCAAPLAASSGLLIRTMSEETPTTFGDAELRFEIHELLGQGGFGSVYRCSVASSRLEHHDDLQLAVGEEFAVKVIDGQRIALLVGSAVETVVLRLLREAEVLHMLGKQPNIVTMHGAFFSKESHKLYFIYELLRGGDLFNAIVRRRQPFREREAHHIFIQLAEAVHFGHRRGVAHRDLKLDNCLIKDAGSLIVKVCDYGQAKVITSDAVAKTLTTSASYTAPDVQLAVGSARPYDAFKADAFALGVLLYGLLCNALPNAAKSSAWQENSAWQLLSEGVRDLVRRLLAVDPGKRLSLDAVLMHPWLALSPPAGSSPPCSPERRLGEAEARVVLAAHQLVVALQRERGTCLLAAARGRFQWHVKYTDERHAVAMGLLDEAVGSYDGQLTAAWDKLRATLSCVHSAAESVRAYATQALQGSPARPAVIHGVCHSYSAVISAMMHEIASLLQAACPCDQLDVKAIRHKLLMFTAEQLGRERALVCGHLHHPASLQDPQVARRINEIIGARKLLLGGSSQETSAALPAEGVAWPSLIVTAELGLLPALSLTEAPLLVAEELAQLEDAEDRALTSTGSTAPQLSEWYRLLTKLIDKIHQHVIMNILEHFPPL